MFQINTARSNQSPFRKLSACVINMRIHCNYVSASFGLGTARDTLTYNNGSILYSQQKIKITIPMKAGTVRCIEEEPGGTNVAPKAT